MTTENSQNKKFAALLEWLEEVKFSGTVEMQVMVSNLFEGWLSTDYASNPAERNAYVFNTKLLAKGMTIISTFSEQDLETLEQIM
tara:strand:+ start:380 stop:634 length:255 start_codon:yes stop_codon:yes gene_type:complete